MSDVTTIEVLSSEVRGRIEETTTRASEVVTLMDQLAPKVSRILRDIDAEIEASGIEMMPLDGIAEPLDDLLALVEDIKQRAHALRCSVFGDPAVEVGDCEVAA